jgi:SAM-dependent methyltransferase
MFGARIRPDRRGARRQRPDFSARSGQPEWLDDPDITPDSLAAVLADLDRFNRAMLGHTPMLRWLARAAAPVPKDQPLAILDVGCGSGDLLRAVARWARRTGRAVSLIGVDLNPETIAIARARTPDSDRIRYEAADVFAHRPTEAVDVVVNSLLAHHLPDEDIVALLRWMDATARRGWLVSDLQRSIVPYAFIGLVGRFTDLHPTVIHDGRISVARALTRREWRARVAEAGLADAGVTIRWMLYRFLIGRLKAA